jgi:tungstate transport system substrate-binding protein
VEKAIFPPPGIWKGELQLRKALSLFLILTLILPLFSCQRQGTLILATTTSVQDSGLLDFLIPKFENQYNIKVQAVAVGTGEAITMGQRGDADVLLVHNKTKELELMNAGYGSRRQEICYNDFLLVGPPSDPAQAKGLDVYEALTKIAHTKGAIFVSRGDQSGTHIKELALWGKISLTPTQAEMNYLSSGQGMGETLRISSEKGGYTLTDRSTWLAQKGTLNLEVISQGNKDLLNTYSVILINEQKFPKIHSKEAQLFYSWITSSQTLQLIANFGKDKYGEPLFYIFTP